MDDLLVKINDRNSNASKKNTKKQSKFHNKIDKLLLDHKMLADDLEKYCYNKRLKKNIYKLDMIHCQHNGQKQGIEHSNFTSASCDYERIPRVTNDPVINNMFKRMRNGNPNSAILGGNINTGSNSATGTHRYTGGNTTNGSS